MKFTLELVKAAGIRALKTFIQVIVGGIVIGDSIMQVSWLNIASVAFVAALVSFLQNVLVGLPEASVAGTLNINTSDPIKDSYMFEVDDMETLSNKSSIVLKVKKTQ